jgi:predicted methyltransferase
VDSLDKAAYIVITVQEDPSVYHIMTINPDDRGKVLQRKNVGDPADDPLLTTELEDYSTDKGFMQRYYISKGK